MRNLINVDLFRPSSKTFVHHECGFIKMKSRILFTFACTTEVEKCVFFDVIHSYSSCMKKRAKSSIPIQRGCFFYVHAQETNGFLEFRNLFV